jgi:hypothetical protein
VKQDYRTHVPDHWDEWRRMGGATCKERVPVLKPKFLLHLIMQHCVKTQAWAELKFHPFLTQAVESVWNYKLSHKIIFYNRSRLVWMGTFRIVKSERHTHATMDHMRSTAVTVWQSALHFMLSVSQWYRLRGSLTGDWYHSTMSSSSTSIQWRSGPQFVL